MSFITNNFNSVLEFNNSFSSEIIKKKPNFEGGYLIGPTGYNLKKEREEKENEDFYLQIKCESNTLPTGVAFASYSETSSRILDDYSFSFFIKKYSSENESSLFMGDIVIPNSEGEIGSFACHLSRDATNKYYLKAANGRIGGEKYIEEDVNRKRTFNIPMSNDVGQKIFAMEVEYVDGELTSMNPSLIDDVPEGLIWERDIDGTWNNTDSYSLTVPLAIIDMDSKSVVNFFSSDTSISDGGGGSSVLGLNGITGPLFS